KLTSGGSGLSSPGSFAHYDPASSSWRTSQVCLSGDLETFSETWPSSGMTRNGAVFLRPPLVLPTNEPGSSSWPTLTARDSRTLKGAMDRPNRLGGKSLCQVLLALGHTDC